MLASTCTVAWTVELAGWVHPRVVSSLIVGPKLVAIPAAEPVVVDGRCSTSRGSEHCCC